MHLRVWDMESRLGVKPKFRFPFFRPLMWHTATQLAAGKLDINPPQCSAPGPWFHSICASQVCLCALWAKLFPCWSPCCAQCTKWLRVLSMTSILLASRHK